MLNEITPQHPPTARVRLLQEGLLALWRGWLPSVIGVIPYVGLNFAVYETSKDLILKHYGAFLIPVVCHTRDVVRDVDGPCPCHPSKRWHRCGHASPHLVAFQWQDMS